MIIFHEGLPRSGKSYEACVNRIIPALQSGRQVFGYIEGLNHEKFAELTGLPLETIQGRIEKEVITYEIYDLLPPTDQELYTFSDMGMERTKFVGLLHQINEDQVKTIYNHVANDSMVILDELQDFFPAGQKKLDEDITKFVTQHGHRGIDLICMGQDHRDCHNLWKRRIDQLYAFVKQDAIGRPTHYTWTSYKQKAGKLVKLNSGTGKYDPQYYGLYKSHTDTTTNKETYNDDRANIFKTWGFKYGVPFALAAGLFSTYYLWGVFHGQRSVVKHESLNAKTESEKSKTPIKPADQNNEKSNSRPASIEIRQAADYDHKTYIDTVITRYRPRLSALITGKNKIVAKIDFLDDTLHVKETFGIPQLQALGWQYSITAYGLLLTKGLKNVVVTAWPIDVVTKVSNEVSSHL